MKSILSNLKPIKTRKQPGTTYCFECKDYTKNFIPKIVNMTNKVVKENSHCIVCRFNKSRFLKQQINNWLCNNKMNTCCLKCKTNTDSIDPTMVKTKNNRWLMQSTCSVCGTKKSRFVKEQGAKGLVRQSGIKTPLSKISLLNVLF